MLKTKLDQGSQQNTTAPPLAQINELQSQLQEAKLESNSYKGQILDLEAAILRLHSERDSLKAKFEIWRSNFEKDYSQKKTDLEIGFQESIQKKQSEIK